MDLHSLGLVALAVLVYCLVSGRLARTIVTAPIVFVALGLVVGEAGLGLAHLDVDQRWVQILAEATLIFVLFTDAARIDAGALRRGLSLPARLLGIGLPLTIGLGTLFAKLVFPGLAWYEAALIAAILAPTDAALGQAVVSSKRVPKSLRQALNVESGINDGVVLPAVTILVVTCSMMEVQMPLSEWIGFVGKQLGFGVLVGLGIGWLGGRIVDAATDFDWMERSFGQIATLAVALLAYIAAHLVEGNGFIAAFLAGLVYGATARAHHMEITKFAEEEGELLSLLTFLIFGGALAPLALEHADARTFLYAALSLTVVRGVPVLLSLWGTERKLYDRLFLAWFGPRGLASILFALLVVERTPLGSATQIVAVVYFTVLLSVVLHGVTALPATRLFAREAQSGSA